jgi:protein phosphatase
MKIAAGVATDIGKVREGNEDSYLIEHPLYAVADGMGGHRGGDVASQLALETIEEGFREGRGAIADQIRDANRAVFERSAADEAVRGMGTTLTAALVTPEGLHLAHVGDSRAYLLRGGALRQLTEDHTLINRMIRTGEITPDEAEVHPHRNVLLRSLGTEADVEVDEQDVGLLDGDRVILCSDGLTNMITEDQLLAIGGAAPTPQDAADRLVRAANRAGGIDNITVVVLDVRTEEGDPPPVAPPARAPRSWRRIALGVAIAVIIVVASLTGARAWLDSRWYVGVANGHVAVFQGIPATVLGFDLSRVDLETAVPAADAEVLPLYTDLDEGLNVDSREEALAAVEQIEADIAAAAAASQSGGNR